MSIIYKVFGDKSDKLQVVFLHLKSTKKSFLTLAGYLRIREIFYFFFVLPVKLEFSSP